MRAGIYPRPARGLGRRNSGTARRLPLRVPASVVAVAGRHGTVDPFAIAYGCDALGLGPADPTRTYLASEPSGLRRSGFPPGCTCPAVLRILLHRDDSFRLRGSHPLRPAVPGPFD
jgi:hypothetical protein